MQIPRYISLSIVSAWFGGKQRRTIGQRDLFKFSLVPNVPHFLKLFRRPLVRKHHILENKQHKLLKQRRLNYKLETGPHFSHCFCRSSETYLLKKIQNHNTHTQNAIKCSNATARLLSHQFPVELLINKC